jgi:hypothetical protein
MITTALQFHTSTNKTERHDKTKILLKVALNGIHSYILFKVGTETYDFFPMNRALCLSSVNIDSTESKIDDLLSRVTSIAMKQKEEVIYIG